MERGDAHSAPADWRQWQSQLGVTERPLDAPSEIEGTETTRDAARQPEAAVVEHRIDSDEQRRGELRGSVGRKPAGASDITRATRGGRLRGADFAEGPIAYDVPEVLRRLKVTRPTIYRFLRAGELRSFRLGSRRLVSAEALAEFIRSRESAELG
jgi:excisionase family DNA binding protein